MTDELKKKSNSNSNIKQKDRSMHLKQMKIIYETVFWDPEVR